MTIDEVKDFFEKRDYNYCDKFLPVECTCRYGITYTTKWNGYYGTIWRSWNLMRRCCCWVCHNHDCKEPRNEIIKNCGNSCELWSKIHYCEKKENKSEKDIEKEKATLEREIEEYTSILDDLYEEVKMYEEKIEEAEGKLNQLNKNG